MNIRKNGLSCEQAKQLDLVDYLRHLGFEPTRISQPSNWFCSPFRTEREASFKVNRKMNRWFDFGEGKGGNLVDFGTLYFKCSVREFLEKLNMQQVTIPIIQQPPNERQDHENAIRITDVRPITSLALIRYLKDRRIPEEIYRQHCKQVHYELKGKPYYAIGFKNNAGGYELRNEHVKASSSPKDVTLIDGGKPEVAVFEGFFDFLTYLSIQSRDTAIKTDFLILNSASFFEKSRAIMDRYPTANLFLDRDTTGQKCSRMALDWDKSRYRDQSHLYNGYKDLNEWAIHIGKHPSQCQHQRIR